MHDDIEQILISAEELADDLNFVQQAFREKRTTGTIAEARGEDFFFGRAAFALEVTAGKPAGSGVFFTVIDGERKPVLAGFRGLRDGRGDEDIGFADGDIDRAIGELGVGAG